MGNFAALVMNLDQASNNRRGKQFEHICQWFLTNDPVYAAQLRQVWLWDEWPRRWGIDAGIDLVAEDHDGHLWAIQAKAYDPAYRVTKRDVNKFLAEAGRPIFSFRLLIATTNLIDKIAERTIQGQGTASFLNLSALEAAQVDWPSSPSRLTVAKPVKPKKPRPHQRDAIRDVLKGFQSADRGQLIMACGTGKTLAALFIKEKLDAERTLILLPSLSLLKQTLREWTANKTTGFEFQAVCSDDTVVGDDVALAHASDLGLPVTTDPAEIAGFLRRRSGRRVVFATYQSSPQVAKAFALGRVPKFDLVVADEAHRCAGPVSSDFATVLDVAKIRARRRLFMTATPRYFTGRLVREAMEAEYEIASMDNDEVFGTVFHRLPFGEAIGLKLLSDYQVVIVGVDDATYREWAERGELVVLDGATPRKTDARTLAGQIGLAKAMRKYDLQRVISFHSRVNRARDFARSMPDVIAWMPARQRPKGRLWADYASGNMTAGDREVRLYHLARLEDEERGLLANARCLAEGIDVPTLDGVAFVDPRRSEVDIVQAVGRAIRNSDDKTVGTIVIPVFIDTDEDPEVALDDSAFRPVWDVIKALRSHDEELGEQLDELRRALGRRGARVKLPSKIHVNVPSKVGAEFAAAFDVRLVERTTVSWEFWFGLLEQFVNETGHARVRADDDIDGYRLGAWVANQRTQHAKGVLKPQRRDALEAVPGWTWDPIKDYWVDQWSEQWEEGFRQLLRYVEREGNALVPTSLVTSSGYRLGWWVTWQRQLHGDLELEADRERRLSALPGWTWDTRATQWEEGFTNLVEYVNQYGDARVAVTYNFDGFQLGSWVKVQRREFAKGSLAPDRQTRLEELPGWTWDPFTDQWEDGFKQVANYVASNGDARVPRSHTADGFNLGAWVKKQRGAFGRGLLDADRRRRLEALPGWTWDPFSDQWEEGFRRLSNYVEQRGNARVPKSCIIDGFNLGSWVHVQRQKHSRGNLDAKRQRRLEALSGWKWEALSDKWEDGFRHMLAYVIQYGHARVPRWTETEDGYRLGAWVNTQRNSYKAGTLTVDRQERLLKLPGWTFDSRAGQWDDAYQRLLEYAEETGSADIPRSTKVGGFQLGAWVGNQRVAHTKGALAKEREDLLTALPGWTWNSREGQWDQYYSLLLRYVKTQGNPRVPSSFEMDGRKLGIWVVGQRAKFKLRALDPQRVQRLNEIPGWSWDPFADQWNQGYSILVDYVRYNGDARVPRSYVVDGFALGGWVQKQRSIFNRGGGDPERRRRLDELPGWSWTVA
ncbi:DEAD/DEAH box helicase [Mycobacterium yunnanensis]|nr:DEAD/DEAH box helicase [Mycobacterium yunnanensis]